MNRRGVAIWAVRTDRKGGLIGVSGDETDSSLNTFARPDGELGRSLLWTSSHTSANGVLLTYQDGTSAGFRVTVGFDLGRGVDVDWKRTINVPPRLDWVQDVAAIGGTYEVRGELPAERHASCLELLHPPTGARYVLGIGTWRAHRVTGSVPASVPPGDYVIRACTNLTFSNRIPIRIWKPVLYTPPWSF
jgi:hypothetical protein